MKIGIIGVRGYPYVYGGYETFAKELAERLVKRNVEVTIYCHRNLFKEHPAEVNGIKLKYFRSFNSKNLSQLIHSFQSILHASFSKYDLVLVVNSANGPLGVFPRLFGARTAINVDGLEWLRPKWKGFGAKYFYWASRLSTMLFDIVITDSTEMSKVYQEEFKTDSVTIAYGANIKISSSPELITEWGIQPNEYFLVVGRLIPDNNIETILVEFAHSSTTKKLVVVGDVPYKDEFAERIKSFSDPRIIFTGYVTDQNKLSELYHNAFYYIHGHEFGGTNPAMLKALAYGCAIIAHDNRFNREMLEDGTYGYFFNKSPGTLASLISELEANPGKAELLKNNSRERISSNYTWDKITDEYLKLIQKASKGFKINRFGTVSANE